MCYIYISRFWPITIYWGRIDVVFGIVQLYGWHKADNPWGHGDASDDNSMGDLQDPIDWRYLPYIFGLFFKPKFQGISPENMAKNMIRLGTSMYWILEISHWIYPNRIQIIPNMKVNFCQHHGVYGMVNPPAPKVPRRFLCACVNR